MTLCALNVTKSALSANNELRYSLFQWFKDLGHCSDTTWSTFVHFDGSQLNQSVEKN